MAAPTPKKRVKRRVGRPRKEDAIDTRAVILAVAVELFGRHGHDGASIRAIAEGAGVSMSTLFHHFGDKRGLFDACVNATYAKVSALREHFAEAMKGAGTAKEALRPIIRATLRFSFENHAFVRVVVGAAVTTGRIPEHVRERVSSPTLEEVAPLLASFTGRTLVEMRMVAMSCNHLIARYAVTDMAELAGHLMVDPKLDDAARDEAVLQGLEDHLHSLFSPQLN